MPQATIDVHTTGELLEPSWKASELQLEDSQVRQVEWHAIIASGPDGDLWLFTGSEEALEVTLLDDEGNVLGGRSVPPPIGPDVKGRGAFGSVRAATSHPHGPVVNVEWGLVCRGAGPEVRSENCSSPLSEALVFGTGVDEPPMRVLPFGPDNLGDAIDTLYRSAGGDAVLLNGATSGLQKFDLQGNVAWRRDLSLDQFDQLPQTQTRQTGVTPFHSGAVAPDGRLILGIEMWLKSGEHDWRVFPTGLLGIDEAGTASVRLYDSAQPGTPAVGEGPPNRANGAVAFDSRGRLLAAYQQLGGDLLVLRVDDRDIEAIRLLREDYSDLSLGDMTVDPAGTLYLATEGGGREEVRPLLCRIPEQGDASCFSVPNYIHDIEAPAPGRVFAVTSQGLERFAFP